MLDITDQMWKEVVDKLNCTWRKYPFTNHTSTKISCMGATLYSRYDSGERTEDLYNTIWFYNWAYGDKD